MFESSPSSLPDRLQHSSSSSSSSQVRRWENRRRHHWQPEQFIARIMSASANGDSFVMASPSYKRPRVNSDFDDCDDPLSRRAIQVYNEATRFVTKPFIARLSMAAELDNHHREFQFDDDVVDEFGIQVYGSEYDRGADEAGGSLDLLHPDNSSLCCTYKCRNLVRKYFFSVSSFPRRSKNLLSLKTQKSFSVRCPFQVWKIGFELQSCPWSFRVPPPALSHLLFRVFSGRDCGLLDS